MVDPDAARPPGEAAAAVVDSDEPRPVGAAEAFARLRARNEREAGG
ncbi:MAG TPA: hypothetical protein VNI84_20450 [Pyrinomonadaceae bacterium]|nr:hypothetical protein [Pyrinomonadaceae bacterium]